MARERISILALDDYPSGVVRSYATATRTHADPTAAAVTDGDVGGTADGALEAVGATNSGDVSGAIENNFKDLQAAVNALVTDLANAKQVLNSVVDDLQEKGLVG